ncbi:MAG: sensor domain-containing diguanylate cyclase [bacterium]|nr:sensor domain-containing diguanylate cyclase [bacterium]
MVKHPEDIFRILVENSPDAVLAVNRQGVIRFMNAAAEEFLGRSAKRMTGEKVDFSFNSQRAQEISIIRKGKDVGVAEVLSTEARLGREKIYILTLRDITERIHTQEQLRALSDTDPLTGLLNRRGFVSAAERQLRLAQRTEREMVMYFIDLDGMKNVNDTLGHVEGDQAIIDVARILKKSFRNPDLVGRYGGDEFSVLAIEGKGRSADAIVTRLNENLKTHNSKKRGLRKLSLSVGYARYNAETNITIENLIEEADAMMYKNKQAKLRVKKKK